MNDRRRKLEYKLGPTGSMVLLLLAVNARGYARG